MQIETVAQPHPLRTAARFSEVEHGLTVAEIVESHDLDPAYGLPVVVLVYGSESAVVPPEQWERVRPKPGTRVEIGYPVQIAAIGPLVSWAAGTIAAGITASALGQTLITAAISVVAGLAIQALIPPPPQRDSIQAQQNYAITGVQNVELRYGSYPKVIGRMRMYPVKTATGFTETVGDDDIYHYGRMTFGYGTVALEDLRIGQTPIDEFDDIQLEFLNIDETETLAMYPELGPITKAWRTGTATLELYPDDIAEDVYSAELTFQNAVTHNTRLDSIAASVDIAFPRGIGEIKPEGDIRARTVTFDIEYRPAAGGTWTLASQPSIQAKTRDGLRRTFKVEFPTAGEYQIRVTRTREDTPDSEEETSSYLSAIRSIGVGKLPSHANIAEVAYRIRASEQLNGVIDSLNGLVFQMAPKWTGSAWTAPQLVRHPAWQYMDALRGAHMRNPVPDAKIDLAGLKAWFDAEPHWACDFVVDNEMRLADVLDTICAAGRAKRSLTDFQYSVIRDQGAGPVRQVFTPRNVRSFRWSKAYGREIHGFRVRVRSEALDYEFDEFNVYRDGYSSANASEFETLELIGVTHGLDDITQGNAWRLARYMLAQYVLRPETFEFEADFEVLRCTRGDKVKIIHDAVLIGVGQGRIAAINGSTVTLDEDLGVTGAHRLTVRLPDGTIEEWNATGSGRDWTGTGFGAAAVGDLVTVERTDQDSTEVLITNIVPDEDGGARVTAVPASPAVLDADTGTIPDYVPSITNPAGSATKRALLGPDLPVVESIVSNETTALTTPGGEARPRIEVTLASYSGRSLAPATLQLRWRELDSGSQWLMGENRPGSDRILYTAGLILGLTYEVEVRALGPEGRTQGWAPAGTAIAALTSTAPPNVTGFSASPSGFGVDLSWTPIQNYAVRTYQIRHSVLFSTGWDGASVLGEVSHPTATFSAPLKSGFFWIKAIDFAGAFSANAASVEVTSEAVTSELNAAVDDVIDSVNGAIADVEADLATLVGGWTQSLDAFLLDRAPTLTIADLSGVGTHLTQNYYTSSETDTQITAAITALGSTTFLGRYDKTYPGDLELIDGGTAITVEEQADRIVVTETAGTRDTGFLTNGARFVVPLDVNEAFYGRTIRVTMQVYRLTSSTVTMTYSTNGDGNAGLRTFTGLPLNWTTVSFTYDVTEDRTAFGDHYVGIWTDASGGAVAIRGLSVEIDGAAQQLTAELETNYWTGTTTGSAISQAITDLKAEVEDASGSSVAAWVAQNYTTVATVNSAIANANDTLRAELEDPGGDSLGATVEQNRLAAVSADQALASSVETLTTYTGDRYAVALDDLSKVSEEHSSIIVTLQSDGAGGYVTIRENSGNPRTTSTLTTGASIEVPWPFAPTMQGRKVRIRVEAKSNTTTEMRLAYSTHEVGNSGLMFQWLTGDWKTYDFFYDIANGSSGRDSIGIWTNGAGGSIDVRKIIVEPVGAEVEILQSAVSEIDGRSQAALVMRAVAGGQSGEVDIVAFEDADGTGGSAVRVQATNILLNGTVDTLLLPQGAVTVPVSVQSAEKQGTGNWETPLVIAPITMPVAGRLLINWHIRHGYNGAQDWSYRLLVDGTYVDGRFNLTFGNDQPGGVHSLNVGAGAHTVELEWRGENANITATGYLSVFGAQR